MTIKDYLQLPYQTTWKSKVLNIQQVDTRYLITLDRTIFIPTTTAGPSPDTGYIENIPVVRTYEYGGDLVHELHDAIPSGKTTVNLNIDATRRRNTLDQTTVILLMGAVLFNHFNIRIRGYKEVNGKYVVDTTKGYFNKEMVNKMEELLNTYVINPLTITGQWLTQEDENTPKLRFGALTTKPQWITSLGGIDHTPGEIPYHSNTGRLGIIAINSYEEHPHHSRFTISAGKEARLHYKDIKESLEELAELWDTDEPIEFAKHRTELDELGRRHIEKLEDFISINVIKKTDDLINSGLFNGLPVTTLRKIVENRVNEQPVQCYSTIDGEEAQIIWRTDSNMAELPLSIWLKELRNRYRFVASGRDDHMDISCSPSYVEELMLALVKRAEKELKENR
ncbi:MAG: hypothetical protein GXZ11_01805 [Tissierellia bacterium]|nr:hypothetical protein [Tissierellia bacterium]